MKRLSIVLITLSSLLALCTVASMIQPLYSQAVPSSNGNYAYIASATTTTVKPTNGYLHTVTINGGVAGAVTLYDIAGGGCTGTPASGKFATIETIGATNPVTLIYDLATKNGICVVTAAATDLTVSFN